MYIGDEGDARQSSGTRIVDRNWLANKLGEMIAEWLQLAFGETS
jgi:hypothetical protein